jgi:FkbM family methyltransferase
VTNEVDSKTGPSSEFADPRFSSTEIEIGNRGTRKIYFRANTSDGPVIKQVLIDNNYNLGRLRRSSELTNFLDRQRMTGKAPLIIDAGANIGTASIFFASLMPDAHVVAIEPDEDNFRLLEKNVEGLRVQAIRAAAASTKGLVRVIDPGVGHWGYRTENLTGETASGQAVPRLTINDIYRQYSAQCFPFIAKIDIEGGEVDLFAGSTEWVALTPVLIIELHDWLLTKSASSRTFLHCISQLNRDFVHIGDEIYSIANDL